MITHYSLKVVQERTGNRHLIIADSGKVFSVSPLLFDILDNYQHTGDYAKTCHNLNEKYTDKHLSTAFIEQSVTDAFSRLSDKNTGPQPDKYLYCKIPVIKKRSFLNVYNFFAGLFHANVFYSVFILSALCTAFFLGSHNILSFPGIYASSLQHITYKDSPIFYAAFTLIILFHEIGHASAAKAFHAEPGEIGFAFYFVFPVFFSNVTTIWQLPASKRNRVNLAGIYFQLIVNLLLIVLYSLLDSKAIVVTLIIINTASIIGSLNPFFKYDGYWVFCDTCNLPNLAAKSRKVLLQLICKNPLKAFLRCVGESASLVIYSVLRAVFWMWVYIESGRYLLAVSSWLYLQTRNIFEGKTPFTPVILYSVLSSCLLMGLFVNQLYTFYHTVRNERTGIHTAKG